MATRTLKALCLHHCHHHLSGHCFFRPIQMHPGHRWRHHHGHQNGYKTTIRLVGIDAPEKSRKKHDPGQPFSQTSTKYLAGMVLNKNVDIVSYGNDRYGRTLGVVYVDGKNVNLEMVKAGLAEVYRGKPAKGFDNGPYQKAEDEARRAGMGMWSLGDKYISPKDWRKTH